MKAARIVLRNAAPLAAAAGNGGGAGAETTKEVERLSRFSPSPLSIKQFLDFGEGREWGCREGDFWFMAGNLRTCCPKHLSGTEWQGR